MMIRTFRLFVAALLLGTLRSLTPAAAQDLLPLSSYCVFDGSTFADAVYVFSASESFRTAVNRVLNEVGFPLELELLAANVESISAARVGERRYILYNTYVAEGLSDDDWSAWAHLAHAVAHHIQRHTLDWDEDRPLEEVEADQLMGSILYRLGIPLERMQQIAEGLPDRLDRPYPAPALRRAAMTEGWIGTELRNDDKLAFAGGNAETEEPPGRVGPPVPVRPETGDSGVLDRYPAFWPAPQASVQTTVPIPALEQVGTAKLGDVARQIETALDESGYYERAYYSVPDGFAIVARIEQIRADGTPLDPPDRWSLDVKPMRRFSLTEYFKALFTARPGYFRIVAFIITPHRFTQQQEKVSDSQAQAWLDSGLNALPHEIALRSIAPGTTCTALLYTFERPSRGIPLRFVDPSPVPARLHLERAGLWSHLAP